MTDSMYDGAYAPSDAAYAGLYAHGGREFAGYLGGPRAYHPWSADDFARGRKAGFRMVGVFVGDQAANHDPFGYDRGRQHGQQAVSLAQAKGFAPGAILALDVEAGAGGQAVADYCRGWREAVHASGFQAWLYGLVALVNADGAGFDGEWVADYVNADPHASVAPGEVSRPGQAHAWQWRNSHSEAGASVDTSDVDGGSPSPAPTFSTEPRGGRYMLTSVTFSVDSQGGWTETNIPWSSFLSATVQGSDPGADHGYWHGTALVQNRDGKVLVSVVGAEPGRTHTVFIASEDGSEMAALQSRIATLEHEVADLQAEYNGSSAQGGAK